VWRCLSVTRNGALDNVEPHRSHSDRRCRRSRRGALLHPVVVGTTRTARLARVAPALGGVDAPPSHSRRARRGLARRGVPGRGRSEADWPARHDRALSRHRRWPMASLSHRHARGVGRDAAPGATSFRSIGARARRHHDRRDAHRAVRAASTTSGRGRVSQWAHVRRVGAIVTLAPRLGSAHDGERSREAGAPENDGGALGLSSEDDPRPPPGGE